jgi:predicted alpha/beta-hydrolase family hydrolase
MTTLDPTLAHSRDVVPIDEDGVRGFLHRCEKAEDGLVLTHGAGGDCNAPLIVTVANAFQAAGLWVLRYNLPFRQERRFGPPNRAKAAIDRAGLRKAAAFLRAMLPGDLYLGGRQASMLAADEPELAQALLLLSYPLHPPDKPTQLRTAHFPLLKTPVVFVHGSDDPFGAISEMEAAISMIPAAKRMLVVEKAGHDLRRGRFDLGAMVAALAGEPENTQGPQSRGKERLSRRAA